MTVLTSIPLNPLRRGAQKLLTNPQALHAATAACLPETQEPGRILWRLERKTHQVDLLMQAPEAPSLGHIIEQAGWPDSPTGQGRSADLAPLLERLAQGQRWVFRTTLNPVTSISRPGQRGTVTAHTTPAHQLAWFLGRADGSRGFSCSEMDVQLDGHEQLRFRKGDGTRPVTLHTVTFQGILTVTDTDQLRQLLTGGMGRARAYGCGLITLART